MDDRCAIGLGEGPYDAAGVRHGFVPVGDRETAFGCEIEHRRAVRLHAAPYEHACRHPFRTEFRNRGDGLRPPFVRAEAPDLESEAVCARRGADRARGRPVHRRQRTLRESRWG